jgi:hypothetical protein
MIPQYLSTYLPNNTMMTSQNNLNAPHSLTFPIKNLLNKASWGFFWNSSVSYKGKYYWRFVLTGSLHQVVPPSKQTWQCYDWYNFISTGSGDTQQGQSKEHFKVSNAIITPHTWFKWGVLFS